MSQSTINAAKTHCKHGHAFDAENTYVFDRDGRTRRHCRACKRGANRSAQQESRVQLKIVPDERRKQRLLEAWRDPEVSTSDLSERGFSAVEQEWARKTLGPKTRGTADPRFGAMRRAR